MTPRMRTVLDAIENFWGAHGYAPSMDEIAEMVGAKSRSTVHRLCRALRSRGYVWMQSGKKRSIRSRRAVVEGREVVLPNSVIQADEI